MGQSTIYLLGIFSHLSLVSPQPDESPCLLTSDACDHYLYVISICLDCLLLNMSTTINELTVANGLETLPHEVILHIRASLDVIP